MINFIDIEIEGFGSIIKPTKFKLDRGNILSVITGKVGNGKTTIPNALVWSLFGKSLKEKSSIITFEKYQGDKYRGTKVLTRIQTTGGIVEIIRCKSFKGNLSIDGKKVKGGNNIFILIDGKSYKVEGKGKINNQLMINKIIGYSFELFKNAVVFGQKMKRIIQESGPDKKKVFEEAFDLVFIEEAKNNTTDEKKKISNLISKYEKDLEIIDERIDNRENLYNKALDHEQFFKKYQEKDIKHYQDKIAENTERIKKLKVSENISEDISKLSHEKIDVLKKISKVKSSNAIYLNLEKTIKEYQSELSSLIKESSKGFIRCSKCGSKVNEKQQKIEIEHNKERQKKLKKNLSNLQEQFMKIGDHEDVIKYENILRNIEIEMGILNERIKNNEKNKKEIKRLKESNKESENEIKLIKEEKLIIRSQFYSKLINKLTKRHKSIIRTLNKLKEKLDILNWLINDPLSNNGLKAYLFNNLLESVNDKLIDYSKLLGFTIEFGIDLKSHRKDFYQLIERDGVIIPYEDLSGGQQQLVDTSVAFAINDVISELKPTNILFLDEPFESLDTESVEIVSELIYEKSKTKSVYLITHHQAFSTTNAETIYVKLDKNKNTIISN